MRSTSIPTTFASLGVIANVVYVRTDLDWDRVTQLWDILTTPGEDGQPTELDPIEVTTDFVPDGSEYVVIDGRHRIQAYTDAERNQIPIRIVRVKSMEELVARAWLANNRSDAPLPPSSDDRKHTITLLISMGISKRRIAEMLGFPGSLGRKYVDDVVKEIARYNMDQAAKAVSEQDMRPSEAAAQFGVDETKLREKINSSRRAKKVQVNLDEIKAKLTYQQKSDSMKMAAVAKKIIDLFDNGEITEEEAADMFKLLRNQHNQAGRRLKGWEDRFKKKLNPPTD